MRIAESYFGSVVCRPLGPPNIYHIIIRLERHVINRGKNFRLSNILKGGLANCEHFVVPTILMVVNDKICRKDILKKTS